ncbi:hypothetical protein CVT26_006892 [Gymnopilus dilepis]|uniref:Uncharacterized protein n=1 Tax=Gymnopilus dilepis TaxID=231916 RepID=A0A409W135_9AGAR|nr:hypothetical protein CVT26_006892 [Gymnopilus dilepis]
MSRSSPTSGSHTRSLLVSDHPQVQLPFTFVPLPEARAQRNQQLQWQHGSQHHSERIVPSLRPHLRPLEADGHARLPGGAPTKPTKRHPRISNPPSSLALPSPSPSPNPTPLQTSISPDLIRHLNPYRQPPSSPSPHHHGHPPSDQIPSYVDAARHPVFQIESSARSSSQAEVHHQPPYDKRDWQGYPYDRGCQRSSPSASKRGNKTMPKVSSSKRHRSILPAPALARRPSPPPYSSSFLTSGLCTPPLPSPPASQTHKDLYYEYSDSPSPSVPGPPTLSERLTFVPVIPNMTFLPHPDVFLGPLMAHNCDVVRFDSRSPEPWAVRRVDFEVESEFEPEVVDGMPPPSVVDMMGGELEVVSVDADDLWSASMQSRLSSQQSDLLIFFHSLLLSADAQKMKLRSTLMLQIRTSDAWTRTVSVCNLTFTNSIQMEINLASRLCQ